MAYVSVNPGKMFHGNPHIPTDVTAFQLTDGHDSHYEKWRRLNNVWFQKTPLTPTELTSLASL